MQLLFKEDFKTIKGDEPGNWFVEMNSDLPFSAYRCDGKKISMLSPGNKYIPLSHPFTDGEIKFRLGIDLVAAGRADFRVCFRYDRYRRRGECVRLSRTPESSILEYGMNIDNVFYPTASRMIDLADAVFDEPVEFAVRAVGNSITVGIGSVTATFHTTEKPIAGFAALTRGQMYCLADIYDFAIHADIDDPAPKNVTDYRIAYPDEAVMHRITCDVTLKDFGGFYEAEFTIGGGVKTTPVGEGNYHGIRMDVLDKPYFKVITQGHVDKFTLHHGKIIWLKDEIAPTYLFKTLHEKVEWPFHARVRFMKPETDFTLALGADTFYNSVWKGHALTPGETLFTKEGDVLDAGIGISEINAKVTFSSQKNKAIIAILPKDDPQYAKAVAFAENNHYFLEGEKMDFCIEVLSRNELPETAEFTLETAFHEPLRPVAVERKVFNVQLGVLDFAKAAYAFSIEDLKPGVYHLRYRSTDVSVSPVEEYCAFEVMSRKQGAPPPPTISGIPFLYNNRSETRGLETDSFDPWHGKSMDDGHYMACTTFMPKWARDHRIGPMIHAYQREWFLWLGTRNCDHPAIEDNKDLIEHADYINYYDEVASNHVLWAYLVQGELLEVFLKFAVETGDKGFDLDKIRELARNGESIDLKNFSHLAEHHWNAWLDHYAASKRAAFDAAFDTCRALSPNIKSAGYGPGAIYASHYKGCEFVKYRPLVPAEQAGFGQYEDYPATCRYGIERGTYYFTACLLALPARRIYPEIYTGGSLQGCPDGAVNFAHPPYGMRETINPLFIKRRVYDYALASAQFTGNGFEYWHDAGFQACEFNRGHFEALLAAWRTVRNYPPAHPLKSSAFVYSDESWNADSGQTIIQDYGGIVDVRKSITEDVPFAYEEARQHQIAAGFLTTMDHVSKLTAEQVDTLVLPPLEGVSRKYIDAIRKLHEQGVNLVAFENVPGLEDVFGVEDTSVYKRAINFKTVGGFLPGMTEYSGEVRCVGKYRVTDADVLVAAEIPVLTLRKNATASAAFFNVPPTLVNDDRHCRLGYGRDSISPLINAAMTAIMKQFSDSPATVSKGRLIAYRSANDATILVVTNPDENDSIHPVLAFRKSSAAEAVVACDMPYTLLSENDRELRIRIRLEHEESAVFVIRSLQH